MGDTQIEQVASYKYLGIQMDNQLKWNVHIDYLFAKLAQRLHFLRRLRLFGVSKGVMSTFYDAVLGSIIRYGMAAWYGTLSVQLKSRIAKMEKTAMKVIGEKDSPSLQATFEKTVVSWQIEYCLTLRIFCTLSMNCYLLLGVSERAAVGTTVINCLFYLPPLLY